MDATNDIADLVSAGRLATQCEVSIPTLRRVLERLGVVPVMRLDGRDMFRAEVADLVFDDLKKESAR